MNYLAWLDCLRSSEGEIPYSFLKVSLNWRILRNPDWWAMAVIGASLSEIMRFAASTRRERATLFGLAPTVALE